MPGKEEKDPVTDTFLEDYEEFLDEEERWLPPGMEGLRRRKTRYPLHRVPDVRAR
jgi:hypothetical protein